MPNAGSLYYIKNIHELSVIMGIVLFFLSVGSIFFGYFAKDLFVGFGSTFLHEPIYINPSNSIHFDVEFIPFFFKNTPTFFTIAGLTFGYITYFLDVKYQYTQIPVYIIRFFNNK